MQCLLNTDESDAEVRTEEWFRKSLQICCNSVKKCARHLIMIAVTESSWSKTSQHTVPCLSMMMNMMSTMNMVNLWMKRSDETALLVTFNNQFHSLVGCDSSPRSPNVSVFVCHTCYNCTKALNFKVFRLKDFLRTSEGLTSRSPQVFETCWS